jgi:hypothetical protein
MPPKKRRGGRPKKKNNFGTYNKARQDAKLADAKAAEAKQATQPTATPPDPPPAASSEAKPSSSSSLPHSIEENLVVPTPQIGSGSTGTATSAPGAAAQPKASVRYLNKRGRRKGESGRQTAAATEARVAQEARDFVLNAPVPPKEPKFLPDSSGMSLRPDSNCLWLSADHNREQPKPRPNHFLPASGVHFLHGKHPPHVLFCAERACGACCFFVLPAPRAQGPPEQGARNYKEEQQDKAKGRRGTTTKAGAAAQSWELGAEQQEHQLGSTQHHAARQLGDCACTCACQGLPLKTEPFQSHLARATRQLSSQF